MKKTILYCRQLVSASRIRTLLFAFLFSVVSFGQKTFKLSSPDGKLETNIEIGKTIEFSISQDKDLLMEKSPISMSIQGHKSFGIGSSLSGSSAQKVNETIYPVIYKKKSIQNQYNQFTFKFKEGFNLIFRAYNDGIAYRFVSLRKGELIVENEQAQYNFSSETKAYIAYVQNEGNSLESQFFNSFENRYEHILLKNWNAKRLAFSPLLIESATGKKICIVESDLLDYPGMYLYNGDGSNSIKGIFAPCPKRIEQGGHNMLQGVVKSRENFIAKYPNGGNISFPWRAFVVADKDYDLTANDMVYKLASPRDPNSDFSWVKPGKVAWDWWNDWNLYHVDFKTGVNTQTYKYYIDFASKHQIEYVILDEGWAVNMKADLFQIVPEIDLKELIAYAKERNVNLILWAGYYAFNKNIEGICKYYSGMGIKGFKVDFIDRDDQKMVEFYRKASEIAAKYHLMLDFHGAYKPTGLQHTYPNVINFEGVHGLEQMKWSPPTVDQVTYDVTFPFIRMVAGPVDYTQGAMRNASKDSYRPVNSEPMSQGTRCRQLAEYVIFDSPLNMLCDSPSNYMSEEECLDFISSVPTTWDETIPLNGEISKYLTMARRKGDVWYIGSLTNWDDRQLDLNLSFLGQGSFKATLFKDGINADKSAKDYQKEEIEIPADRKITIKMASGGGFVMKVSRK